MESNASSSMLLSRPPSSPLRSVSTSLTFHASVSATSSKRLLFGSRGSTKLRLHYSTGTFRRFQVVCSAGDFIAEIDESQFEETVLKSDRPVLVEFVASWCGPCRLISPAVESIAQEYQDRLVVVKIDHDANPRLIEEFKVYGLPALILFKNGKEIPESRREGAITKAKLKEYVDSLLESTSVA